MKPGRSVATAAGIALALGVVIFAVRVARHYPAFRIETGRFKITRLDPATRSRLETLHDHVFLTCFLSPPERMPSQMRGMGRELDQLFGALQGASHGLLDYQIVDPESDPDLARYAARRKISPVRVRSVEHDGYSEQQVWCGLTIAYGAHPVALLPSLSPDDLPRLQATIAGTLDQMERPRRPVIALSVPQGSAGSYTALRDSLASRGRVIPVDLDSGAAIPREADLLFWMDPGRFNAARLRELNLFLDGGRTAIVAGSVFTAELTRGAGGPEVRLRPTGYDAETFLGEFGLHPVKGLVLDETCEDLLIDGVKRDVPLVVRCIGYDQDFRTLRGQPNGTLLFETPTAMSLDAGRLAERDWNPEILATTSDKTWIQLLPPGPVALADLTPEHGDRVPRQALLVGLHHSEPSSGWLLVAGASTLFRNELLNHPNAAHVRLLRVLLDSFTTDDRLVAASVRTGRQAPLSELPPSTRLLWRLICILLPPVVLIALGVAVGRFRRGPVRAASRRHPVRVRPSGRRWPNSARAIAGGGAALVLLVLLVAASRRIGLQADLTGERLNSLTPESREIASLVRGDPPIEAELIFSSHDRLPESMRGSLKRLAAMLEEFRRAGVNLRIKRIDPADLSQAERAELDAAGIAPAKVTTRDQEVTQVRTVYSALRLRRGERTEILRFPDPASFDNLEFRLAFGWWRLATGRHPQVVFASDTPRMSPAEQLEFEQHGLSSPMGTDVYSLARAAVANCDFRVSHVNPHDPVLPAEDDLLVWLQPRRDASKMYEELVRHLHAGGRAILAVQHFNMQSRQYPGSDFKIVYWPQPQFPDVELLYFPEIGVQLVREVLFDELRTHLPLQTQVMRGGRTEYKPMEAALPFMLRASAANFSPSSPITQSLGDQGFLYASYLRWDDARLAELGLRATPLITTSAHTWSLDWQGGWLPDSLLAGPPRGADGKPIWLGRVPLAVLFEGNFPLPSKPLRINISPMFAGLQGMPAEEESLATAPRAPAAAPAVPGAPGKLLFIGCSEAFKNYRLAEPEFRGDQLLINAVATLALDEKLARIATRRPVERGFDLTSSAERLKWRVVVVAAFPLALVGFGFLLERLRRRTPAATGKGLK